MRSSLFPVLALALSFGIFAVSPTAGQMQMQQGGQQMQMKEGMQMETAKEGVFEGQGKIVALVPAKNQVVLQHGEIKALMGPMTMGYALASQSLAKGLKPGDSVKFKIDGAKKQITAIERLPK
jgi:Cu/Ag efflux protein CusF